MVIQKEYKALSMSVYTGMTKKYSKPIRLRGHHLRILYHYACYTNANEDRLMNLYDGTIRTAVTQV